MENKIKHGEALFVKGRSEDAEKVFREVLRRNQGNKEALNNLGVIAFQRGDIEQAIENFTKAIETDACYKEAILNYATIARETQALHSMIPLLEKAIERSPADKEFSDLLNEARLYQPSSIKIVILCLPGLESFLRNIVSFFKTRYEVRTCYSNNIQEIESAVLWADLVWMEWANEMAVNVTRHFPILSEKEVICRLHSYEAFVGYPKHIDWTLVNSLIVVSDHLRNIVRELTPEIKNTPIHVIPNGIDLNVWKFAQRKPGYDIAYVGSINYKKGSILLPHLLKAVCDRNPRYRLHIAGEIQDPRYIFYFKQAVEDMGLGQKFVVHGRVDDVDRWLEDKNYIVSTSLLESQQLSLCEAMAKGIKPVIHNFVGAKAVYPGKYVFNTIDKATDMICDQNYESQEYRRFVSEKYHIKDQLKAIDKLIRDALRPQDFLAARALVFPADTERSTVRLTEQSINSGNDGLSAASDKPLVSVLIATHNRSSMLDQLLGNLQAQSYKSYELVVVNDKSTDDTESVIERWLAKGLNIRYLKNEANIGGVASFDKAYEHSNGDYVLILSDDDLLKPDALQKMVETAYRDKSEIVYCDLDLIDVSGNNVGRWSYKSYPDYRNLLAELITTGANRIPECPLIKRSAFEEYKRTYTDRFISTYYLMNLRRKRFSYIPEALYEYRVHINSQARDLKGMWQRNNGVINHINAIVFMYSLSEIFPHVQWPKGRKSLARGYALIASILFQLGNNFISGQYYNGLRYREEDGLFLLFYKFAHIWLKRAIGYGASERDVEKLLTKLEKLKGFWSGQAFRKKCFMEMNYSVLPNLALLPKRRFNTLVALDLLVLGEGSLPEHIPIDGTEDRRVIVQVHQLKHKQDIQKIEQYLQSNLIHAVIAKGKANGLYVLRLLDKLELFSIPVLVLVNGDDSIGNERWETEINEFLSPKRVERFSKSSKRGILGFEGLTAQGLLERVRHVFECY